MTLKDWGTGIIRAIDPASGKEAEAGFAIFDRELLSQYTVCLGESVVLPVADKDAEWEIVSGDDKVEEIFDGNFEGIKAGTAKLEYSTEVGEFTTKIKVAKHKFDIKTGECKNC